MDVIGAATPKEDCSFSCTGVGRRMSLALDRSGRRDSSRGRYVGSECEVMTIIGIVDGICGTRSMSSGVRAEFDIKRRVSFYDARVRYYPI